MALGQELVRVHDWLREELAALRVAASAGTPADVGSRLLLAHCARFCSALDRHHTSESGRAFPALAVEFPDLGPVLAKLEEDHVLIGGILARIDDVAAALADGGDAPRLVGELDGLAAIMESHFAFEERRIVDALDELTGLPATELLGPLPTP